MKTNKIVFTKNCLIRALRTFLQTAIGYIITNVTLVMGGVDFADGDVLRNALIGLAIAAFSAGSAAVMNLERVDRNKDENTENLNQEKERGENLNG